MNRKRSISIRLSEEAYQRCEEAKNKGYSKTDFIIQAIMNLPYYDKAHEQNLLPHFCAIAESIASIKGNTAIKEELREELDAVCRYLSFRPEHM